MPSNVVFKVANAIHGGLTAITFGKLGWSLQGMPVLELTTTGRKSGQPRTNRLTAPVHDGDTYVIVASRGGDDTSPAWFLNLRDNPDVEIKTKDGGHAMRARVVAGDERAELWDRITTDHKNYADYQTKTERQIPVVMLEPRP